MILERAARIFLLSSGDLVRCPTRSQICYLNYHSFVELSVHVDDTGYLSGADDRVSRGYESRGVKSARTSYIRSAFNISGWKSHAQPLAWGY